MVAITFVVSIALVDSLAIRVVLVAVGSILAVFLYRIPTAQPDDESVTMEPSQTREESP